MYYLHRLNLYCKTQLLQYTECVTSFQSVMRLFLHPIQ
nr:MAG TPA: hypothetical protein [Caudoviricetes sp.]